MRSLFILLCLTGTAIAQPDPRLAKLRSEAGDYMSFQLSDTGPRAAVILMRTAGLLAMLADAEAAAGNQEKAKQARTQAITAYTRFVEQFKDHPQLDFMLNGLASTHLEAGDDAQARAVSMRLIKHFPNSGHVPSALARLGDLAFKQDLMSPAVKFYSAIIKKWPQFPLAGHAQHRLAWCHYNLKDGTAALDGFVKTIAWARANGDSKLQTEAENDLVPAYAFGGKPAQAKAFFEKTAPKRAALLLKNLARLYDHQNKPTKAAAVRSQR